jgi:hypothetical protein
VALHNQLLSIHAGFGANRFAHLPSHFWQVFATPGGPQQTASGDVEFLRDDAPGRTGVGAVSNQSQIHVEARREPSCLQSSGFWLAFSFNVTRYLRR